MKFALPILVSMAMLVDAAAISYALTVTDVVYLYSTTTVLFFNEPPATDAPSTTDLSQPTSSTVAQTSSSESQAVTTDAPAPTTTSTPSAPSTTSTSSPDAQPTPATTSSTTSTASAPTQNANAGLNQFESDILNEHNKKRALHGVQPLTWNPTLAQYAADYASKAFSCDNVQLIHSHGPYGENLAAGYVGGISPVDAWYGEISQYNYNAPGFSENTGHFTQVVWKGTSELGCAYVTCDNAWRQYTICEYQEPGNWLGEFQENVLPLVN